MYGERTKPNANANETWWSTLRKEGKQMSDGMGHVEDSLLEESFQQRLELIYFALLPICGRPQKSIPLVQDDEDNRHVVPRAPMFYRFMGQIVTAFLGVPMLFHVLFNKLHNVLTSKYIEQAIASNEEKIVLLRYSSYLDRLIVYVVIGLLYNAV